MTDQKHKSLFAALAAAQAEMGRAQKDSVNPHFRIKYADLASVQDACMPALTKHGIAVIQPFFDDDTGRYVKTILVHGETGETVECRVPLIVSKNDMQGFGSAATYARRYGLMSMAGIAPEDDDANQAVKSPPKPEPAKPAGPPREAVDAAKASLFNADNLDALKAIWMDLPAPVRAVQDVERAKDARKAELETAPPAAKTEIDDEIPFG